MRLHCELSTPVARTDLDDYVRNLEITIACYDQDCLNEYTVGKLAMDQILWADAIVDGVSLFEICDNDSGSVPGIRRLGRRLAGYGWMKLKGRSLWLAPRQKRLCGCRAVGNHSGDSKSLIANRIAGPPAGQLPSGAQN